VWVLVNATPVLGRDDKVEQVIVSFTDITQRMSQAQQLADSEQLFRTLVENSPDYIARYDLDLRRTYINPALQKQFPQPVDKLLGKTSKQTASPLLAPDRYMQNIRWAIEMAAECSDELAYRSVDGDIHWASMRFTPELDAEGKVTSVLVISNDITDRKHAEQQLQSYLGFFRDLDRVNRVLQGEGDVTQVLERALGEVLDIFDCDRAYLQYPCDPDAGGEWWMPIERCRPEYPSPFPKGQRMPFHPHMADTMRAMLESNKPIQVGVHTNFTIPPEIREKIGVRSFMAVALHPRVDRPWQFGVHQCSYDRAWTEQEMRLLEEIGRRLSDGLNSLLITRNLQESEERYRQFFDNSPLPIREEDYSLVKEYLDSLRQEYGDDLESYLMDRPDVLKECAQLVRVMDINETALAFHEAKNKEQMLQDLSKIFVQESVADYRRVLMVLLGGATSFHLESVVQTMTGRRQNVLVHFSVAPGHEQDLSKVLVSLVDITERKQYEEQLRLGASVFANSQEGILISDADNRIIDVNPAFTRLTGYSREEVLGQNPRMMSSGKQSNEFYADMWKSINNSGEWRGEIWNKRKSGEELAELLSIVAVKDAAGELQHYVGAFSDITMLKQHEADLDRIAHYDVLTSVPNRRLLDDRMEQAIARARRHNNNFAVCYLDLDGFKPINDQFGHEAGDQVLVEIAHRLQMVSRSDDTVARLGGDEFVLLWNDIGDEADCIQALERVLEKVAEPIKVKGEPMEVSASIGVTLYPEDDVDADSLLRHADHAMYSAKQLGKNRYQMFDARLERQITARVDFLDKVAYALEEGQFELYYQPKVDCVSGEVAGAEALIRWNDPILGLVGPREFLPLIENDNLALRVDLWVIEHKIHKARIWDGMGITMPISVNVFPRHLKYRTFAEDLRRAIGENWPQIPENRLQMEIVESSALEDLDLIEGVIKECLQLGVRFSLDDFGTGYSSLVYLRRLSITELKIDQSFVRDMLEDPGDQAIVISVIGLGQAFGLQVVAEGVETTQHVRYLLDLGCSVVQGFALGRPMPTNEFETWHENFLTNGIGMCQ
jgi:diguanylate cyclase (GGDEF)-like protein/PAS domain S-box-containing protein